MANPHKPAGVPAVAPLNRLFQRKSVGQIQAEYHHGELKRSLGPVNLILLGIGCIIGAGIFVRTGSAAALHAGPAVMISFVIAGIVCALAVGLKYRFGYDDSLDVVGVHLVGGLWGTVSIGFFGTTVVNPLGSDGLLYGGGTELLVKQVGGAVLVLAYSFIVTTIIARIIDKTVGFRIARDAEIEGVDLTEHAESAYELDTRTGTGSFGSLRATLEA